MLLTKSRVCAFLTSAAFVALLAFSTPASAEIMYIQGTISGDVNGTYVEFGLDIEMDMETGEETAAVTNMDPEMGAIMRQVTAMVTIAGPTGGGTPQGGKNLFELSGGNFVNSATMYWPETGDTLELIHAVSYTGGDTMHVDATMSGTVPVISGEDEVEFSDFSETLHWDSYCTNCGTDSLTAGKAAPKQAESAEGSSPQVVTTGVGFRGDFSQTHGFRQYLVGGDPFPGGGGKGSTTDYNGSAPGGPVARFARDITSTYDPAERTMHVHLFNTLTPLEPKASTSEPSTSVQE